MAVLNYTHSISRSNIFTWLVDIKMIEETNTRNKLLLTFSEESLY